MGSHSQVALKFSHFTRLVVYLSCSKKTSCNSWPFCFIFYYNLNFININITIVIFIHLLYNTNKCGYNLVARISCFRPDCASSILATRSINFNFIIFYYFTCNLIIGKNRLEIQLFYFFI
jgi:hypothetical protein